MDKLTLYIAREGLEHHTGPGHPESAERLATLLELLAQNPLSDLPTITPGEAEILWVKRAHDGRYIDRLADAIPDRGIVHIDGDTVLSPGSWAAAMTAAGGVCQAVSDIVHGHTQRAFCIARPPGHHAFPDHAEGFCLFNNIVIGALHAQSLGLKKIAIVDFDVHHGNGSDFMARKHEDIFYASTHQWPLYPGTGSPEDNIPGRILNIPMRAGDGSQLFRNIYETAIFPAVKEFHPDLLMISAGFDAHKDDPLAQIELETDDFEWVTAGLAKIANECCQGRIVSVLEGGYDLAALRESSEAHIQGLMSH